MKRTVVAISSGLCKDHAKASLISQETAIKRASPICHCMRNRVIINPGYSCSGGYNLRRGCESEA